jgi:hypothetical protein
VPKALPEQVVREEESTRSSDRVRKPIEPTKCQVHGRESILPFAPTLRRLPKTGEADGRGVTKVSVREQRQEARIRGIDRDIP